MENYNELLNNVEEMEVNNVIEVAEENLVEAIETESLNGLKKATKGLLIGGLVVGGALLVNKYVVPKVREKLQERKLLKEQSEFEDDLGFNDNDDDEF